MGSYTRTKIKTAHPELALRDGPKPRKEMQCQKLLYFTPLLFRKPIPQHTPPEVSSGFEQVGVTLKRMLTNLVRHGDMLHEDVQPQRTTHTPSRPAIPNGGARGPM